MDLPQEQTIPHSRIRTLVRVRVLIVVLTGLVGAGVLTVGLGAFFTLRSFGHNEVIAATYDEFRRQRHSAYLDPVGAETIDYRHVQHIDGYDSWWKLEISEDDGDNLARAIIVDHSGPTDFLWRPHQSFPISTEQSTPSWWTRNEIPAEQAASGKELSWCHDAGGAGRHHGWYLLYVKGSQTMWIWHWNHQWPDDECFD